MMKNNNRLTGRTVLALVMTQYGNTQPKKNNSYVSSDTAVIKDQLELMQLEGIDGVVLCTSGFLAGDTAVSWAATKKMALMAAAKNMKVAVMLDQWSAKNLKPDPTTAFVNTILSQDMQDIINAPNYIAEKAVLEFDVAASAGVNLAAAQAKVKNPIWSRHVHYSWPETSNTIPVLKSDNANPAMRMPGLCRRFNDSKIVAGSQAQSWWDATALGRVLYPSAGAFYNAQIDVMTPLSTQAPYVLLVTWNDCEEETEIESDAAARWGYLIGKGRY